MYKTQRRHTGCEQTNVRNEHEATLHAATFMRSHFTYNNFKLIPTSITRKCWVEISASSRINGNKPCWIVCRHLDSCRPRPLRVPRARQTQP